MVLRPLLRRASKIVRALAWLALFLALPVGAQSSQAARSDSAAVASALHRFLTAFENLDWEPFRDSFRDSATVFHPAANLPKRVTGRGAIDSTFRAVFADVRAHASGGPPFQRLTPADLRPGNPKIKPLIAYEVGRARRHYAFAAPGIPLLEPASQACMRTAYRLYGGILDEVEAADYDVFARRATVPNSRRAAVAIRSLLTRPGTEVSA